MTRPAINLRSARTRGGMRGVGLLFDACSLTSVCVVIWREANSFVLILNVIIGIKGRWLVIVSVMRRLP